MRLQLYPWRQTFNIQRSGGAAYTGLETGPYQTTDRSRGGGQPGDSTGKQLVDTPDFPEAYKAPALAHREALQLYKKEQELEWTYVSPSAETAPGERTGKFRIGSNQLLLDAEGKSFITMDDLAVAIVDEIENPLHIREQMTVGY